jgi:hypothetical protein
MQFLFSGRAKFALKDFPVALSAFEAAAVMLSGIRKPRKLNSATPMLTVAHAAVAKAVSCMCRRFGSP